MNWENVLYIVLSIAAIAVGTVLVPYLKTKVDKKSLAKVREWATVFVEAAEKLAAQQGWDSNEKFQYVMSKIKETLKGLDIYFSDEELTAIIESAVYEVKDAGTK